ncbi:MAG TPA: pyrrolo-quinoline quinone [Planctomycetaceae bacterium]|nr:pyrrolo-quinoline quinone [Planctomycetaceae bacterium]
MAANHLKRFGQLALAVAISTSSTTASWAEDWPNFRGVDRDGISMETGLIDEIPTDGPKLLFTAEGAGHGYGSPAIVGNRMYTLGDNIPDLGTSDEHMCCFDANTGKRLWATKTGEAWDDGRPRSWQGSRATPAVDGDMVYVVTPHGLLIAAQTSDGTIVWKKHLLDDLGGKKGDSWGYSESPLIDGKHLICTPGGPDATVVALDKQTGEKIWTCKRHNCKGAGHASVVISQVGDRKVYVQNTCVGPMGIDSATGELLWEYPFDKPTAFIPTPIIDGNEVYSVAGYNSGGALLKQVASGSGVEIEEIYGINRELHNKHGGVVLIDGHLYFGKQDQPIIMCAELQSGETVWKQRGEGSRSTAISAADGKLFARYQTGELEMIKATPDGFKSLGVFKVPGSGDGDKPSWAHPVISKKRLYLRESNAILVYDLAQ